MITPEPSTLLNLDAPRYALPEDWFISVPAAGHLGVIEERCTDALHEKATEGGRPCPTCHAAL